ARVQSALVDVGDRERRQAVMPVSDTKVRDVGESEVEVAVFVSNIEQMEFMQRLSLPVHRVVSVVRLEQLDPVACRLWDRPHLVTAATSLVSPPPAFRVPVVWIYEDRESRTSDMPLLGEATEFIDDVVQGRAQIVDAVSGR